MVFYQKQAKNRDRLDFKTRDFKSRAYCKLSENPKINVIGPTELKLWPFEDAPCNARSIDR